MVLGRRALRARNALCCLSATLVLAASPASALAQGAAPPSPAETMDAYRTVRDWVRAGSVPDEAPDAGVLPACAGASVVLMLDRDVIGRSS